MSYNQNSKVLSHTNIFKITVEHTEFQKLIWKTYVLQGMFSFGFSSVYFHLQLHQHSFLLSLLQAQMSTYRQSNHSNFTFKWNIATFDTLSATQNKLIARKSHFQVHLTLSFFFYYHLCNSSHAKMGKSRQTHAKEIKTVLCVGTKTYCLCFPLDVQTASYKQLIRTFKIWAIYLHYYFLAHKNLV